MVKLPISPNTAVNVYWGGAKYGILIGTCRMASAYQFAREWMEENSHYFHVENFPPYQRMWGDENCMKIDYGSYTHYLYCIPLK